MNVVLRIPRKPPSLNKLLGMHWASRRRITDGWRDEIPWPTEEEKAKHRRVVKFTRLIGRGEQRYDDDNFIGGCKSIRDALVNMGYILDDDDAGADFEYSQMTDKQGPALVIEISEYF